MEMTGKRRVLYRQGSGFWRMTAKWALFFGALSLLDGGLLRSWGHAVVWPLIGIVLWGPIGETYPDPRPLPPRRSSDGGGSRPDFLDVLD
ncbi:hypothetical protein [Streptomyces sp. NPDC059957]|uniref:hypothetical protein n=1 Tax=unclassified Streptomyces TaxID=2593676 RepID=UPI00365C8551